MGLKKLGFELLPGTGWETAWAAAPAALAGFQAISAQRQLGKVRTDIENYRRQDIENPFANLSNPYENLAVATQAAEMQMEQTDQALANTLDTLRETGAAAGGATAIANAALKSKQGVAASIEKQEAQNQKLQAQGQLQVDIAKGKGETVRMQMQENRDINELNRLQAQSDMAQYRRDSSIQTGLSALGDAAAVRNAGIVPEKKVKTFMNNTNERNNAAQNESERDFQERMESSKIDNSFGDGLKLADEINGPNPTAAANQPPSNSSSSSTNTIGNNNNNNRYGLPEGEYDELNIGTSAALLAGNEYSKGFSDESDAYYNAYKAWHEETYPNQPVTYAGEGQGKIKSFNKALGYKN